MSMMCWVIYHLTSVSSPHLRRSDFHLESSLPHLVCLANSSCWPFNSSVQVGCFERPTLPPRPDIRLFLPSAECCPHTHPLPAVALLRHWAPLSSGAVSDHGVNPEQFESVTVWACFPRMVVILDTLFYSDVSINCPRFFSISGPNYISQTIS